MFRFTRAPALAVVLVALIAAGPAHANTQYPYTLVDPGTFGGPLNALNLPAVPLTQDGALLGTADTTAADTDYPNVNPFITNTPDGYLTHAFAWRNGKLTDLGALPGNNSSAVFEMNGNGVGVGMSETAITDPFTGWPADHAVLFKDGKVIDLGTLPGGYESQATDINDRGQVSGFASNGTPDQFSLLGFGTQTRSFTWQNGVMRDIGTLGGPDALMNVSNELGQITGGSYTNTTPNPATGMPTLDPFLWDNGHIQDLGTLGGTIGIGNWLNNHGEVAGFSDLSGDQTSHPFLWNGRRMIDLGTLGGDNGHANWVNDAGHVVGSADLPSGTHDGFLWADGVMRALPPVNGGPCSNANSVNNRDEVVGNGTNCHGNELAALLWAHGVPFDLNSLTAPSGLHLASAEYISDQGEIVGHGTLANGNQRVFLLIPNQGVPLPFASAAAARSSHDHLRRTHRRNLTAKAGLGGRPCRSRACASLRVRDMRR